MWLTGLVAISFMTIDWKELEPMPFGRSGGATGWLRGEFVIAGGTAWIDGEKRWLNDTQIYSPTTRSWHAGPPLPQGMGYGPSLSKSSGLEVLGGAGAGAVLLEGWHLLAAKKEWLRSGSTPANVLLGAAVSVGGADYLLGGCPDAADLTHCSDAVWRRGSDGNWIEVTKLPQGRIALHAVAAVGSRIYVFGGCSMPTAGVVRNHNEAWSFDTDAIQWTPLPPLPAAVRGSVGAAAGKRILILGGYTDAGFTDSVTVFDTVAMKYTAGPALPVPVLGVQVAVDGKRIYVAGGEDKPRHRSARFFSAELPK